MTESSHGPADVAPILKSLGVLKKDADDEVPFDKSAGDAFLEAIKDLAKVADCVTQLFPNEIPVDQTFFDQLDELENRTPNPSSTKEWILRQQIWVTT